MKQALYTMVFVVQKNNNNHSQQVGLLCGLQSTRLCSDCSHTILPNYWSDVFTGTWFKKKL